jgi:hypothetical protein
MGKLDARGVVVVSVAVRAAWRLGGWVHNHAEQWVGAQLHGKPDPTLKLTERLLVLLLPISAEGMASTPHVRKRVAGRGVTGRGRRAEMQQDLRTLWARPDAASRAFRQKRHCLVLGPNEPMPALPEPPSGSLGPSVSALALGAPPVSRNEDSGVRSATPATPPEPRSDTPWSKADVGAAATLPTADPLSQALAAAVRRPGG